MVLLKLDGPSKATSNIKTDNSIDEGDGRQLLKQPKEIHPSIDYPHPAAFYLDQGQP